MTTFGIGVFSSQSQSTEKLASHNRLVLARIVLKTGATSLGELLMTPRILLVAAC